MSLKMVTFAPMHTANVRRTVALNVLSLTTRLRLRRTSRKSVSMGGFRR
jgi:hypothetical protein